MGETEEKVVYMATHAEEEPYKASIPFVPANAALAMDVKAVLVLQGTGVYLAKKGYIENVFAPELKPMKKLVPNFLKLGGKLMVCVPCIKERQISESDLIEGTELTSSAKVTQELLSAEVQLVF